MENYSDLFVIGGGINGAAIAADAAGRGLRTTLCEKNDLASATSSASSKLIHGGLRYLEQYEFSLVRKALKEREILLKRAPHLIRPLEFVLPQTKTSRPAWLIRLGLFFYDHLIQKKSLPNSKKIKFKNDIRGNHLKSDFIFGFSYFDAITDDARLVIANTLLAREKGANILTYTECVNAVRIKDHWQITLINKKTGHEYLWYAKTLVNATGPWAAQTESQLSKKSTPVQLVKGSHIVIPKLYEGPFAYLLQNDDKRIIFAIPFHENYTLIGTTDLSYSGHLDHVQIDSTEIKYLCNIVNQYFKKQISEHEIAWSYSGVRCLQSVNATHPSEITRNFQLNLDTENNIPLLTIIGGKLTTHRELAEEALTRLSHYFPQMGAPWTANAVLPGGDILNHDLKQFYETVKEKYSRLPSSLVKRLSDNYGTRIHLILNKTNSIEDLGEYFGAGLYQKEIEYLIQHEWASETNDIIWRRTKLGLFMTDAEITKLSRWLSDYYF